MDMWFPRDKGWQFTRAYFENERLAASQKRTMFDEKGIFGWLTGFNMITNLPNITARLRMSGPEGVQEVTLNPYLINLYGFTSPSAGSMSPWVSLYSGILNLYSIVVAPGFPGIPFHGSVECVVESSEATAALIIQLQFALLRLVQDRPKTIITERSNPGPGGDLSSGGLPF